jgi:hypothetical protein
VAAFGGLILLKTCQRLGYFPSLDALPPRLIRHLAMAMGVLRPHDCLQQYEEQGFRTWQLALIRDHLGIKSFGDGGRHVLVGAVLAASRSKDILADISNVGSEALVHARYELPAFSTLRRAAQKARSHINRGYYQQVDGAMDDVQRATLARLLTRADHEAMSLWQRLKREPKQPTPKHIREQLAHVQWLQSLHTAHQALDSIPEVKLQRFADEARAMDMARMHEMQASKRVTLAVALLRVRTAQALDDLAAMFIRRMQKRHHQGNEALAAYRLQHQERTDALIALLGRIVRRWQAEEPPEQRFKTIDTLIGHDAEAIREQCEAHLGYAGNNYLPFLQRCSGTIENCAWMSSRFCIRLRPVRIPHWSKPSPLSYAIAMRTRHGFPAPKRAKALNTYWICHGCRRAGGRPSQVGTGVMSPL